MKFHNIIQKKRSNIILVIDDDPDITAKFKEYFQSQYKIITAPTAELGYLLLQKHDVSVLVCNEYLSGENGLQFIAQITRQFKRLQPVLMSEGIEEDLLLFAINDVGVLKYLKKPLIENNVKKEIHSAYEHYNRSIEIDSMEQEYSRILTEIKSIPYIARRLQHATPIILLNIKATALAASGTITMLVILFFGMGMLAFMLLYIFKSFLGIDLLSESHLLDLL